MKNRKNREVLEQNVEVFDPLHYWDERLQTHPGISGVGYLGRSSRFLEVQYQARKREFELALRQYDLTNLVERSVLDVGSGTGIWLNFWHRHGAKQVVGVDFAQSSVDRLKTQFPDDLVVLADLSILPLPLSDTMRFDIISAFDVLLHIVSPDGLRHAISNLSDHCLSGGWLIISDSIVQGCGYVPMQNGAVHMKVRSLAEYREVLEEYGFVIDSIRPATVLLSSPLEATNRLSYLMFLTYWKTTGLWGRSSLLSNLIGPLIIRGDQIACRLFPRENAPGPKLLFAQKVR